MLIKFKVKNYKSFNDLQEFSFIAGKSDMFNERVNDYNKFKLLKFSAIYGANGSGKSNFIDAIKFMKEMVLSDHIDIPANNYCRLNENNKDKLSYFEVEVVIDNNFYSYGIEFQFAAKQFVAEWLIELRPMSEDIVIFSRKCTLSVSNLKTYDNCLIIKTMTDSLKKNVNNVVSKIYNWFKDLTFDLVPIETLNNITKKMLLENIGLYTKDDTFELSNGTIRYLEIVNTLNSSGNNKVIILDDFDRSLHPNLKKYLINTFLKQAKTTNNQLIIATNDTLLLDDKILRNDEVWFLDNKNGESKLYSLEEYKIISNRNIREDYLNGRFGGVPLINKAI